MYIVDYYIQEPTGSDYWVRRKKSFKRLSDAYAFIILIDESGDDKTSCFLSLTKIW